MAKFFPVDLVGWPAARKQEGRRLLIASSQTARAPSSLLARSLACCAWRAKFASEQPGSLHVSISGGLVVEAVVDRRKG